MSRMTQNYCKEPYQMTHSIVCKIRPVTWKICVQGEQSAQQVRSMLDRNGFDSTSLVQEPDLHDPGTFSFIATPPKESPLTSEELVALLEQDPTIDVAFADSP
jgi:hypothetical protein